MAYHWLTEHADNVLLFLFYSFVVVIDLPSPPSPRPPPDATLLGSGKLHVFKQYFSDGMPVVSHPILSGSRPLMQMSLYPTPLGTYFYLVLTCKLCISRVYICTV